jgi:hypothetical protein
MEGTKWRLLPGGGALAGRGSGGKGAAPPPPPRKPGQQQQQARGGGVGARGWSKVTSHLQASPPRTLNRQHLFLWIHREGQGAAGGPPLALSEQAELARSTLQGSAEDIALPIYSPASVQRRSLGDHAGGVVAHVSAGGGWLLPMVPLRGPVELGYGFWAISGELLRQPARWQRYCSFKHCTAHNLGISSSTFLTAMGVAVFFSATGSLGDQHRCP